jgi:hypothetical protein
LDAYRSYVQKFPQSRHTLRALVRLADDALSRGKNDEAGSFVSMLESRFSGNALADGAVARLRLARNVGQPFSVKLRSIDGVEIDTAAYASHIVLNCVWHSSRPESAEFAKQISAFLAETQSSRAVGVCIADSVEATRQAVQLMGTTWPQCNDGLGRGGEFVRRWGVRTTPSVLVVDRLGRLAGCGDARSWRALADRAATTPQSPAR